MTPVELAFGVPALAALALTLWHHLEARAWRPAAPAPPPAWPGVTLLKPLHGADNRSAECLASWLAQDYPGPVQVLLGVDPADAAAVRLAEEALARHPHADAAVIPCPGRGAANPKVAKLRQLEPHARHDVLVLSDADTRVAPDLLRTLAAELHGAGTGLVHCLYRQPEPRGLPAVFEALLVNGDFWPQVLQARRLGLSDLALGAVMAVRRPALDAAGGLAALGEFLADDHELGRRVARAGWRVRLSTAVADCLETPAGAVKTWRHQLRWARTARACRPAAYFFSVLGNPLFGPLLWLAATGFAPSAAAAVSGWTALRMALAADHWYRITGRRPGWRTLLVPAADLLRAALWAAALAGRRVGWGGDEFELHPGGRLAPVNAVASATLPHVTSPARPA